MASLKLKPVKKPDKIMTYWKKEWKVVLLIIIFGTIFNAGMSFGPILQGRLIDTIVNEQPLNVVIKQGAMLIIVILMIQVMRFFKRYYVRLFANRTSATMRMMIYNNIMNEDTVKLENEKTGDLMTRVISDVGLCVEGMRKVTTEVFDTGVLMISYIVSMVIYDAKLTVLSCLFVPLAMFIAERLKVVIYKYSKAFRKQSSLVAENTYYNIEHAVLFKINGVEEKENEVYFNELDDLAKKSVQANMLENSMQPIYNVIAASGIIFIIYFGGKNVMIGKWTIGMFSTYISIFTALSFKASKASKLFNSAQKASVSWQRIKPYLTDYKVKDESWKEDKSNKNDFLKVENLSFSYPKEEEKVIKNIRFSASKGEIIGVTGPIASGKSALGIALEGIYPYGGSIKLCDVELKDYNSYELSRRISYLGHEPQLLSDTIYNNITLGDDGDVKGVLKDVCFDEDLKNMKDGINTVVGNSGVRLSGGQQARIALARALYRRSSVLILDDPFSAVDMKTEEKIIGNIRKNYGENIIILISHRLSCFPDTDKVIVMHNDKTVEYGTHDSLMKSSELYQSIYNLQNRGGIDEE